MDKIIWNDLFKRLQNEYPQFGDISITLTYHSSKLVKISFNKSDLTLIKEGEDNEKK